MKKRIGMLLAAAVTMGAMAEITNTVKVTKFHQSYPYSGKATVEYTVGGTLPANAVAEITLNTDDASATFTQRNIVTGANTFTIDFASSFGGVLLLTNASFVVTIELGGVQLWENGPYWAECNVGASKPEDYGYYFWWGDTVGYTNTGSGWISVKDGTENLFTDSGPAVSTYDKSIATLQSEGWIVSQDGTYVLAPAHDAAHVHLGGNWRMPTDTEQSALNDNCDWTWTTRNGVNGYEVRGRGNYASNSIFFPAAGLGRGSLLNDAGSLGTCWSSVPYSDSYSDGAWGLYFGSGGHETSSNYRYRGQPVRAVQGFTK